MSHSPRFLRLCDEARARIKEISIDEVNARLSRGEQFHLIDVREESEFAKNRIPKARHVGKGVVERDIEKAVPNLGDEIVLYCGGGFRSALAAENLERMGYTNVKSMADGIRGWMEKGLAVEK